MNSPGVVASWRARMAQFHREHEIPWSRYRFADALLERAEELEAIGDLRALRSIEQRLEHWITRHRSFLPSPPKGEAGERRELERSWDRVVVVREIEEFRRRLRLFRTMVPKYEFSRFSQRISKLEEGMNTGELEETLMLRLRKLRAELIERCFRSIRSIDLRDSDPMAEYPEEIPVGPYNSRAIISESLGMIAQTDPIWTGDLLALYGTLHRLGRQLGTADYK